MSDNKNTKLNTLTGWDKRVESLKKYINDLGETTLETLATTGFFCSEIKRSKSHSPALALSILLHTSSGAVGDNFDTKNSTEEKCDIITKVIAPALSAEEVKAMNLENAKNTIKALRAKGLDDNTISDIVKHFPEGKRALDEEKVGAK